MTETVMKVPALAVVGTDHRIVQSTESFRQRYAGAQALCEKSPELEQVLTGRVDTAVISVGDLSVEIEAVTDEAGRRHAMLSLPPVERVAAPAAPITALRDAAEESSAIVWVKDLEGRYLYANPRYLRDLDTAEERLLGKSDIDLPEAETVDGPRRRYAEDGFQEPLQLEYTVPAIDHRPALAAFRFALRDDEGQPIGTCGVAAPVNEAQGAREEALRLMQLERWNRLDPMDARAELLEQWHVHAASPTGMPGGAEADGSDPDGEARAPQVVADPDALPEPEVVREWAERADQLQRELQRTQAQMRQVEAESEQLRMAALLAAEETERWRSKLDEANLELERTRAEPQADLEQTRAELERSRAELRHAQAELERAQADARAAHSEAETARAELGAARAQVESLRGPSASALRLSEELGRALALERERGDELERALARIRTRIGDFETALERTPVAHSAKSEIASANY